MTIYDLNWMPSRIGDGFFATCKFEDGIVAHLCSFDGATYRLTIGLREDGNKVHEGLDKERASSLLNFYAMAHSV